MEKQIPEQIIQSYINANNLSRLQGIEDEFLNQMGKRVKLEDLINSVSFQGFRDGFEENSHIHFDIANLFNKMFFESLSYKNLQTPISYVQDFFVKTLEYNTGYLIGASYAFNSR